MGSVPRGKDRKISVARSTTMTSETSTEATVIVIRINFISWMLAYIHMRRYNPKAKNTGGMTSKDTPISQ